MSERAGSYRVTTNAGLSAALRSNSKSSRKGVVERTFDSDTPGPDVIRFLFSKHNWRQTFVASMLRVDVSTVRRWTADLEQRQYSPIPYAQWLLLLLLAGEIDTSDLELPVTDALTL